MINLIDKNLWTWETYTGNIVNRDKAYASVFDPSLTEFDYGTINCYAKQGEFEGWYMDPVTWERKTQIVNYAIGHMVSKYQYGFGTYTMVCRLSNFQGCVPAFWFVDWMDPKQGGMGMPPEIDVFEYNRKDKFLSRFHITATYHDGPTYENDKSIESVRRSCLPMEWNDVTSQLIWNETKLSIIINNKMILEINKSDYPHFPYKSMNIMMGQQVNMFNGKPILINENEPFIIKSLTFDPE